MTIASKDLWHDELDLDRQISDAEADELLIGGIDMHTHPGPSPFPRRISIEDAARDAASQNFRAIVVKSHHLSMQTDVLALNSSGLGDLPIQVFAGIALNDSVGGLNPWAVELVLKLGGKVVWFPTISSPAHIKHHHDITGKFPKSGFALRENTPISILDDNGSVRDVVRDILSIIAEQNAVLNCGHLPANEISKLIPAAKSAGVQKIVVSHPEFIIGATPEQFEGWAREGVYLEHCLAMMVTQHAEGDPMDLINRFGAVGPFQTILSSDLGQSQMPLPMTGFRRIVRRLIDNGTSGDDIQAMVGGNAAQLLFA